MKEQQVLNLFYVPSSLALGSAMCSTNGYCDKCYKKWKEFWIHDKEKTGEEFLIHDLQGLIEIYESLLSKYGLKPSWSPLTVGESR